MSKNGFIHEAMNFLKKEIISLEVLNQYNYFILS